MISKKIYIKFTLKISRYAQLNIMCYNGRTHVEKFINLWGRFGFDRVIDLSKLRVGALFFDKNEQLKTNANNVVEGNFAPRAHALAA